MNWLIQHWYVVWGLLGLAVVVAVGIHFRNHPESKGARVFFLLFPVSDPTILEPTSTNPFRPTPLAFLLFAIGILILLLAMLFVPGFP